VIGLYSTVDFDPKETPGGHCSIRDNVDLCGGEGQEETWRALRIKADDRAVQERRTSLPSHD
jgi:hypothetical protein